MPMQKARVRRVSPRENSTSRVLLRCLAFAVIFVKKKVSRMVFLSLLVVFLLINQSIALETGIGESDTPFRMNKLNMIWKKAQNKMSEQKLSDFRRLLELQDRAEIRWKELKARGGDEDGEMEAMIRQKFARILEQFGLEKHLDSTDRGVNEINDNKAGNGMFGDRRLSELWESVEKQGLCLLVPLYTPYKMGERFLLIDNQQSFHQDMLKIRQKRRKTRGILQASCVATCRSAWEDMHGSPMPDITLTQAITLISIHACQR